MHLFIGFWQSFFNFKVQAGIGLDGVKVKPPFSFWIISLKSMANCLNFILYSCLSHFLNSSDLLTCFFGCSPRVFLKFSLSGNCVWKNVLLDIIVSGIMFYWTFLQFSLCWMALFCCWNWNLLGFLCCSALRLKNIFKVHEYCRNLRIKRPPARFHVSFICLATAFTVL